MAVKSIYGGKQASFGGAMNMETGLGFVFLSAPDFGVAYDEDTGMATSGTLGTYTAEEALGKVSTINNLNSPGIQGLIVQQLDIRADRPITTFYDISSASVYYVAGRSSATMGLNRIVGPRGILLKWYRMFGSPCLSPYNFIVIDISKSACDEKGQKVDPTTGTTGSASGAASADNLVVSHCVLMQVSLSISVQNFVITETGQIQGTQLSIVTP
jgi:hypothetical protein